MVNKDIYKISLLRLHSTLFDRDTLQRSEWQVYTWNFVFVVVSTQPSTTRQTSTRTATGCSLAKRKHWNRTVRLWRKTTRASWATGDVVHGSRARIQFSRAACDSSCGGGDRRRRHLSTAETTTLPDASRVTVELMIYIPTINVVDDAEQCTAGLCRRRKH